MKKLNWQDAVDFCKNLEFAGHDHWRLPSITELESLVDKSRLNPALPESHPFLNVRGSYYWSSTTYANYTYNAWNVSMSDGYMYYFLKYYNLYVWPVRGGQFDTFGDLIILGLQEGQERFTDNLDGTVTDNLTGLVWIKDLNLF